MALNMRMLNQLGVCSSYSFQIKAVKSLSRSASQLAKKVANDPYKIKMLPYDNFNWMTHAWETSALHKSQTHDEVSALLVILPTPPGEDTFKITSIEQFKEKSRHNINPIIALSDILPSNDDQVIFHKNAAIHIQNILAGLFDDKILNKQQLSIPPFTDDNAIDPIRTEEHYLPTFDQEQGSTQGNMIVLEHYFHKILAIPKETFENTMFTVLGDRLTVARDRAAQDQRALDLSPDAFDHLSSICTVGGLMHYEMNFISAIAGNFWGSEKSTDAISLSTLHKLFPTLVLKAAINVTETCSVNELSSHILSNTTCLAEIATSIMRQFVTSPTHLEALKIKKLPSDTLNGHAVLLFHNILTLREMHDAVKQGHPTCVLCMIKYWMPMFYAAGCYNYANECMETLHNIIHDWPMPYADIAFKGMFFNPKGCKEDFKPTDIHVEHLNDHIKEPAHGTNVTPAVPEKIVPAMGYVQNLTDHIFEEMGAENLNQHHTHVLQTKDVLIVLQHFEAHHLFDFTMDIPSSHKVTDLYTWHRQHLARHKLRLRERHSLSSSDSQDKDLANRLE
ncbi:hypothetical protein BDQ17DRAFT_1474907 [Cyathus striatus]|nr:hypothetical protein BDQ17DRAFT_1474907 [Cyathus striatus]